MRLSISQLMILITCFGVVFYLRLRSVGGNTDQSDNFSHRVGFISSHGSQYACSQSLIEYKKMSLQRRKVNVGGWGGKLFDNLTRTPHEKCFTH